MSKVTISEFIISIIELVEAQFDEMRYSIHKSAKSIIFMLVAGLLMLVGFIFALLGLRLYIASYVGDIASYFITAIITLILSIIIAKVASWNTARHRRY